MLLRQKRQWMQSHNAELPKQRTQKRKNDCETCPSKISQRPTISFPALLSRLGAVRAALDGHGGGIAVTRCSSTESGLDIVLDLTGACLSCGAAPGTLEGVKTDLENDDEIHSILFSSALLDTFDELGREFILAHGKVEFVDA